MPFSDVHCFKDLLNNVQGMVVKLLLHTKDWSCNLYRKGHTNDKCYIMIELITWNIRRLIHVSREKMFTFFLVTQTQISTYVRTKWWKLSCESSQKCSAVYNLQYQNHVFHIIRIRNRFALIIKTWSTFIKYVL